MPSRFNDRGRMLAQALRDDPEFNKAKFAAEFTEPYGTMASMARIMRGEGDAFDYVGAMPVLGLPARYAKRFRNIEKTAKEAKMHMSRELLTEMDIDDFLDLARPGREESKLKALDNVESFDDVPMLSLETSGKTSKVVGHEGRHRAMTLKKRGEKTIPVRLRDRHIRWDQQESPGFDFVKEWPERLESETGTYIGDFPIKRGESGVVSRSGKLNLELAPLSQELEQLMKDMGIR